MKSSKNFKSCSFCPTDKIESELYKCPKCQRLYCSIRCYRSKSHLNCSEEFYKTQCKQFAEEEEASSKNGNENGENIGRPTTTFEQYMEQRDKGETGLDEEQINPEIPLPGGASADEQILFDSDDEPEYLGSIVESTMEQFEKMDDEELNRKLLAAGLPIGVGTNNKSDEEASQEQLEQLYQQLDNEEKKTFTKMAEELFQEEFKTMTNCFKTKKKK